MKRNERRAAAMLSFALLLGGCAAQGEGNPDFAGSAVTATPAQTVEQSAQPTQVPPTPTPQPTDTPAPTREPIPVTVEGKSLSQSALTAQGKIMLPLLETMERLSYKATVSELSENDGIRRVHTFKKDQEEVAVSYHLQDNTVSDVSFARDKMIVPVDRLLVFEEDTIFAPANFFEEALGVFISEENGSVRVGTTQMETPANEEGETP